MKVFFIHLGDSGEKLKINRHWSSQISKFTERQDLVFFIAQNQLTVGMIGCNSALQYINLFGLFPSSGTADKTSIFCWKINTQNDSWNLFLISEGQFINQCHIYCLQHMGKTGILQLWPTSELSAQWCCAGWPLFCPPSLNSSDQMTGRAAGWPLAPPSFGSMTTGQLPHRTWPLFNPSRITARLLENIFHMAASCRSFMSKTCAITPTLRSTVATGVCVPSTLFSVHST